MKKITFGVLMLFMLAACSNPIDAGGDDGEVRNVQDTSLHTDTGEGVSSGTDSLYKDDASGNGQNNGFPGVNTVTGEIKKTEGTSKGPQGATGQQENNPSTNIN